jgi:DNA-directed RNA polymerase specialized sigma24 family protein
MDDNRHLSFDEVRRALNRLRPPDIVRLTALAGNWAIGLRGHSAEDLLNEAIARVLDGRRPWPSYMPLHRFFSGVMRSVAFEWRGDERREQPYDDVKGFAVTLLEDETTVDHETGDLVVQMRRSLADDRQARDVFDHLLADSDRGEAQAAIGIDAVTYDTARRRMCRHLFKMFSSGWPQ